MPSSAQQPTAAPLTPKEQRWADAAQKPLDILALVFLFSFVMLWAFPDAPAAVTHALNAVTWIVWGAFAVDYVIRLRLSPDTWRYVRTHKLNLLMVAVPMLRLLRVVLLLRRSLESVSTERIASSIVSIVVVVVITAAFLVWRVEYNAPGANITSFRIAMWWAVVTTTTVGYGDYTPITPQGRLIATALMLVGIGLLGTISASVAAYFVGRANPSEEPADEETTAVPAADAAEASDGGDAVADLRARLMSLAAEQTRIRELLEQIAARGA